jgi:hypothetical protein
MSKNEKNYYQRTRNLLKNKKATATKSEIFVNNEKNTVAFLEFFLIFC